MSARRDDRNLTGLVGEFGGRGGGLAPSEVPEEGDGRRLRRSRNRTAVVDALLTLYQEGNLRPSTGEVAGRSGLSARSVFRYFDDVDDLCRAAVARALEQAWPLVSIPVEPHAPIGDRIEAVVAQRFALFKAIRQVATISRLEAPFHPVLAGELARNRAFLRDQLRMLFAAELDEREGAEATSLLAGADLLCSFESYQLLLTDQALSITSARRALVHALSRLFGAPS